MDALFGIILLLIVGGVAWCVAAEGGWGSVLTFFSVLFAGILTMNFFEPVAGIFDGMGEAVQPYSDVVAFLLLFALFVFLFRLATDNISQVEIEMDSRIYQIGRWLFGLATGYLTMAILLTAMHTAPLPREFIGFRPEADNLFEFSAPDRQWLGFTQYISENVLPNGKIFDGPKYAMPPDGGQVRIWSSFPIRYATKRLDYGSGRSVAGGGGGKIAPASGGGVSGAPTSGGSSAPAGF